MCGHYLVEPEACTPAVIAPVHFGAITEALRKVCADRLFGEIATKIVDDNKTWGTFANDVKLLIEKLGIPEERKAHLRNAVGLMNNMPHKAVTESILARLKLQLGNNEGQAWRRRNDAAHGRAIPVGSELEAIQDTKLLRGLFDRTLLRFVNASDVYIDYSTPGHPIRQLAEAPTDPSSAAG